MKDRNPSHVLNKPENPGKRLLTVEEAAIYLGISPRSLYNGVHRRSKKPFPVKAKRLGRCVRFDRKELDAYIESL